MATVEELTKAQSTAIPATTSPAVKAPTEGENRINSMFDAQKESQLKQLENSYNQSMTAHQEAKDKISPQYQTAANDLAVQHERNKRNLNMQAAANGINTGTASQMALAQNNAHLRDFGNLRKSESEALATADRNIANLTTKYQGDVGAAIADNDYKRAAALLDEYNTQYNRDMAKAETLASYGDFSMYAQLYGQTQADAMKANWAAERPQLALMSGAITQGQYENLVSGRPMNEGLDAAGNRVGGAVVGTVSTPYNDPWAYGGSGWNPSGSQAFADAASTVKTHEDIDAAEGLTQSDRNHLHYLLDN